MDAKTRYRKRLKLQAAMTRLLEVLARNSALGIPADRTTAAMAATLGKLLTDFAGEAGVRVDSSKGPDISRFVDLKKARRKETRARYIRGIRRNWKLTGPIPPAPPADPATGVAGTSSGG